jgi:hypothetical protein
MPTIRHLLAAFALLAACVATVPARASLGTNFTDQWWAGPAESGWGASIHQQYDVMFIILFVQGPDTRPVWYAGPAYYQYNTGMPVFAGALYQTNGPWFGGDFSYLATTERTVGTVTFTATSVDTGTLTYSVDGTVVTKAIERQPWANEDFTGEYYGGLDYSASGCSDPTTNGYFERFGPLHVDHNLVSSMTIVAQSTAATCTFTGSYTQAGHMGAVTGSFDCGGGTAGPMQIYEMERTGSGMTARFVAQSGSCSIAGRLGGIERESPRH